MALLSLEGLSLPFLIIFFSTISHLAPLTSGVMMKGLFTDQAIDG